MFKFFTQKKWFLWSIFGSLFILVSTWYQVQLDVKINEWFGEFYDTLQKALTTPNSVTESEFIGYLFTFAKIAALWIIIAVFTGFFTSHWVFIRNIDFSFSHKWSEWQDSNLRPSGPKPDALPGCATLRKLY